MAMKYTNIFPFNPNLNFWFIFKPSGNPGLELQNSVPELAKLARLR
jgi:hypothetical protein